MPFFPGSLLNPLEILSHNSPFKHQQVPMVALSPVPPSEMA